MSADDVVKAALAYEVAWSRYSKASPGADSVEVRLAKADAHQALLEAVRDYREYRREVNQ